MLLAEKLVISIMAKSMELVNNKARPRPGPLILCIFFDPWSSRDQSYEIPVYLHFVKCYFKTSQKGPRTMGSDWLTPAAQSVLRGMWPLCSGWLALCAS